MSWLKRATTVEEEINQLEASKAWPNSITFPSQPLSSIAWSCENFIAVAAENGLEVIHLDSHVIKKKASVHKAEVPPRPDEIPLELENFSELLHKFHRKALYKAAHFPNEFSWHSKAIYDPSFFFHQIKLERLKTMAKTKELQANPTLQIDSINFPQTVKFWPDHPSSSPPIGGSIMFVQTKDHRLLCYRFCEANPPYWDVMAELTEVVRKKKIAEYEMYNPNIHTQADSYDFKDPDIDNAGMQFYALISSLNLIDFCFLNACNDGELSVIMLFQDGSVFEVGVNITTYHVTVKNCLLLITGKDGVIPKGIARVKAMSSIPLYLVWSSDGELYLLESSGNGLKLCSSAKFSDYETHCVSSVLDRNGKLRIFGGRINLIESFMVDINGDDILINKNSYSKISSTNTLGFMRIDAKLISGTVRCTAVSQDGLITTVELTGQGHLQNFGALKQVEKPVDSRIVSTAFSPHSTTLCVGFKKSTIVHKVCDKGVAVINWFPIMDDSEFEPELAKVITSVSFKEEMLPSIVDFVLPMKRINSTFYEIQRCLQNSNMNTLSYFLNKTLLSNETGEMEIRNGSILSANCSFCDLEYEIETLPDQQREEERIPCLRCKMPKPFVRSFNETQTLAVIS